jgi:hypothetical protein
MFAQAAATRNRMRSYGVNLDLTDADSPAKT